MAKHLLLGARDLPGGSCLDCSGDHPHENFTAVQSRARFPKKAVTHQWQQDQGTDISFVRSDILNYEASDSDREATASIFSSSGYIADDELLREEKLAGSLPKEESNYSHNYSLAANKSSHRITSNRQYTTGLYYTSDEETIEFGQIQFKEGTKGTLPLYNDDYYNNKCIISQIVDTKMPPALEESPASQGYTDTSEAVYSSSSDAQNEAFDDQDRVVSDIGSMVPDMDPAPPVKRGPGRPPKKRGVSKAATTKTTNVRQDSGSEGGVLNLQDIDDKEPASVKLDGARDITRRRISTPFIYEEDSDGDQSGHGSSTDQSDEGIVEEQTDFSEPSPVKRGRGRPAKNIFPSEPIITKASSVSEDIEDVEDDAGEHNHAGDSEIEEPEPAPEKRGRGRPPGKRRSSTVLATETPVKRQRTTASAVASEPRRSSRIRSSGDNSISATKTAMIQPPPTQTTTPRAAKPRGRPRKSRSAVKTPAKVPKYADEAEEEWEVEAIEDSLIDRQGGTHYYKVKWKGYPPSANTWEPRAALDKCQDLVDAYQNRNKKTRKSKK